MNAPANHPPTGPGEDGMQEFETTDPAGHVLVFGEDTDEAPTD